VGRWRHSSRACKTREDGVWNGVTRRLCSSGDKYRSTAGALSLPGWACGIRACIAHMANLDEFAKHHMCDVRATQTQL